MKKIIIEGMTCGHCKRAVEEKLKLIKDIGKVEVYLDKKTAYISGDVGEDTLKRSIEEEGYKVVLIEMIKVEEKNKKGFLGKLLEKIERSNSDSFGGGRMECCDLTKNKKEGK